MTPSSLPPLLVAVPFAAAVLSALLPWRRAALAHWLATAAMAIDTGLAVWLAIGVVGSGTPVHGAHAMWLPLGALELGIGTFADPMGAIMAVIVCALATLVLAFNTWYMHDDARAARFPWQFCGFAAAMLGIVVSDNLFLSFVCWELVGLGSYLLIGFWADRPAASLDPDYQANKHPGARGVVESRLSPAMAQLKAFVMNRVGDAAFLLGIGALLALAQASGHTGAVLGFADVGGWTNGADQVVFLGLSGKSLAILAALGVFGGAVGKSAQFPLHTWLPDAMQGPTTASAIIHAATMVAAGVFLVARCYPLFPPEALQVVGWTGGITCLLTASIACVQWDLKAVLAYSTCSQLGLMFVALGAGAENGGLVAGIAHLFTHATFKCLLFLCAAAVIHACHGHQDLHRMGGLWRKMPVTAAASGLAVLAITGAPFGSGFFSKDAVLAAALEHAQHDGGAAWGPFVLACAGSLLTGAYMLRWWLSVFAGRARDAAVVDHAHDPSAVAKFVLVALMPCTLALPWTAGGWLDRALRSLPPGTLVPGDEANAAHGTAALVAMLLLAVGAAAALLLFAGDAARGRAARLAAALRPLHAFCAELWFVDRAWDRLWRRGAGEQVPAAAARVDLGSAERLQALEHAGARPRSWSLDGLVDGLGGACRRLGRLGSLAHNGHLGGYLAAASVLAAAVVLWGLLW